ITNTLSKEYDSQVSIFGTSRFLSSKSDNYGWFVDEAFLLPYYISKKLFFRYIIFPSQTIYLTKGITADDERRFLDGVVCLIKNDLRHVDFILQSPTNVVFKIYPNNSIFCQFGTYVVDLLQDENNIFKQIHQKHRNVIKKAQSDGVAIVNGKQYCNEVLNIINQTMLRQKMTPFNSVAVNEFECLNKNIEYYVSIYKNIVQGAALIYWDQYSAYYMYGGSIDKPHSGSLNLMHWQIIQDMKKKGIQKYDFVGARIHPLKYSKISTIQRFKARFGGCMKIGYLWKYPIKPFKYKMFNIIKTLYSIL
ncbi:peptidoglycan bridge formation glycyltransferase FemA/FemB family protein, partial [Campylobacter concisus]|uniref:peptidoglycan bridge formation glycyltransferase FemA/FemB family protein n=1 Tax=Campylobacter concisus TaxID=199 RepID=UPI00122D1BDD